MGEKIKAGGSKNGQFNQSGKQLHEPSYTYADKKEPKNKGESLSKEIEKNAPNANLKSTILAQKGIKDIASVVAQTDPQGTGQIAPQMYQMMQQIFTAISAGSGSSGSSKSPPNSDTKKTVEDALTGALSILANKYPFEQITETFNKALANDGIKLIDKEYRTIVKNALANLYTNYILYGPGNMPYFVPSSVVENVGPLPSPLVTVVPDLYVQQYYYPVNDPYPGFIKWVATQEDEELEEVAVFTQRKLGDPYYVTADEEIYSIAEQELATNLDLYVETVTLTAKILNDLLDIEIGGVEKNKMEKTNGKNSSSNLLSILIKLAGYAGQIVQSQQSTHLPPSVLNKGSISQSQNKFMENIGKMRDMKQKGKKAATPPSAVASLGASVLPEVISKISSSNGSDETSKAEAEETTKNLYEIINN
jgi:hypothetical protein